MNTTQLLRDQKQELEEGLKKKKIIAREVEEHAREILSSKLIKVITGVRRCGKSVLAYSMMKDKDFAYINFDDERLYSPDTNQILSSFYEIYGKNFNFMFLDEIQNLERWELFINRLHRAGFNLVITGSNSRLLSKELATHLTGRHLTIELFPFSFREYLKAINFKEDVQTTKGISIVKRELNNYINNGGFPEIIVEKESPGVYLRKLYGNILERDIISRHNISYKKTFREMAINLISTPGRSISYNKLKKQYNLGSEHTIKNYLSYLEEAYLIFFLNRFSYKSIEIEKSDKKVYAIDTGLTNNLATKFSENYGHAYENTVAIELLRQKSFNTNIEIYYWKNLQHEEVDFVIKQGLKVRQLIQVCYNIEDFNTKEREMKALIKASKEIRCKDLLIITQDYEAEETAKGKKIRFLPLWKWLLK